MHPHLVSPEWLSERLDDGSLRPLDATVWLRLDPEGKRSSIESGRDHWATGHIPGAGFVDLLELSNPDYPLPLMLPSAEAFAERMSRLGLGPGTHVVAYDAAGTMWAARLWWMLRVFGFDAVSVLDGGWKGWRDGGHPVSTEPPQHPPARFEARFRPELLATREEVEAHVAGGDSCLVNALAPEHFRGEVPIVPGRPGRIPRSVNVPSQALLDPDTKRFLPPERLREHFDAVGALEGDRPVLTYCGAGIAASMDAFGLALVGREDAAVYDGSLFEWASDPERPLETG